MNRGQATLTEHWDGTSWKIINSPNPGNHISPQLSSALVLSLAEKKDCSLSRSH
jgi:hypothetical protein